MLFLKPFGRSIDNQMEALFFAMRGRCIDHAMNDIEAEGYVCALLIFFKNRGESIDQFDTSFSSL